MKRKIIVFITLVTALAITGCGSKKEEKKPTKELTVQEIKNIENKYINSTNVFNITDTQIISNNIVFYGKVSKGSIAKHNIVEYIDNYGNLNKTVVVSIAKTGENNNNMISLDESAGVIFDGNTKLNSSIVFKRKDYKGFVIRVEKEVNNIELNKKVKIVIDNKNYNATIVASSYNIDAKWTDIYLITDDNCNYSESKSVTIKELSLTGKMVEQLK